MEAIIYDLKLNCITSKEFYKDLAIFTDWIMSESYPLLQPIFLSFNTYLKSQGYKETEFQEVVLEFITLGTLWRVYSRFASGLHGTKSGIMNILYRYNLNKKIGTKMWKKLKGFLTGALMWQRFDSKPMVAEQTLPNMSKLIGWLKASGEFVQEVRKIDRWYSFLKTIEVKEGEDLLRTAVSLALWFEEQSIYSLGKYTENVQKFLSSLDENEKWREDSVFRMRRRVEYHLNMFGAEVLNRSFREAFLKTKKKILLLPACMAISYTCKKQKNAQGYSCLACNDKCNVNNFNEIGKIHGFDTIIISHESSVATLSKHEELFDKETGVIGVACVLNLLSGGWMLEEQQIPAQCVLLDYCGCKSHWHDEGIPTGINFEQLQIILKDS